MKNKGKITGILFFAVLLLGIVYLSVFSGREKADRIVKISISGNNYLSSQIYKDFAKLENQEGCRHLTPPDIKDRLEKHPYIEKADVRQNGSEVFVTVHEKKFTAKCLTDSALYLLGGEYQLVPEFPYTTNMDLPVISNIRLDTKIKRNTVVGTPEFKTAMKIMECLRLVNERIYNALSEIDMHNGKDISLSFRGTDCAVVLGRGSEVKKIIYLDKIWPKICGFSTDSYVNFIDLRFDKKIYFGMKRQEVAEEGVI